MVKSIFLTALCAWPCLTAAQPAAAKAPLSATLAAMQQQIEQLQRQVQSRQLLSQSTQAPVTDLQTLIVPSTQYPNQPALKHGCKTALDGAPINTIQDALACLNTVRIVGDGRVTIKLTQAPLFLYDTIDINHPNSSQIDIIGQCADEERCAITFLEDQNGITIENNHTLGTLSNLTLRGQRTEDGALNQNSGILVNNNALLVRGENLIVDGFQAGVRVLGGSNVYLHNVVLQHNETGAYVADISQLKGVNMSSQNNRFGFYAYSKSYIQLSGATTGYQNSSYDLVSQLNSTVQCQPSCEIKSHVEWHDSWLYL